MSRELKHEETLCWLRGKWSPAKQPLLSPLDRSYLYGDGVFETFRSRGGRFFRLDCHLQRLHRGLQFLGISLELSRDQLREMAAGALEAFAPQDVVFRLTVSRGSGWQQLQHDDPGVTLLARPARQDPGPPPGACIASIRRDERSPLAGIKTCNWLTGVVAQREASDRGYQEAILLSYSGHLAEAASSNLFWVRSGALYTPSVACGGLPGVMRQALIDAAAGAGIPVSEGAWFPEELSGADAVLLTDSGRGLRPLLGLDDHRFPDPERLPVVWQLTEALENSIQDESR